MLNKAIFSGRLTADPDIRDAGQSRVAKFTLAVERRFRKKDERPDVDFIPCAAWNHDAEFAARYFRKGMLVIVVGEINNNNWEKNGVKHRDFVCRVSELHFAESKQKSETRDNAVDAGGGATDFVPDFSPQGAADGFGEIESEDELPF